MLHTAVTSVKAEHNHDGSTYNIRVVQYGGPGQPCATSSAHLPEAVREALLRWVIDATPEGAARIAHALDLLTVKR